MTAPGLNGVIGSPRRSNDQSEHLQYDIGSYVQTLTRAMHFIHYKAVDGVTPAGIFAIPSDFVDEPVSC